MEKELRYIPRCDDCPYCGHGYVAYHGTLALEELMQGDPAGRIQQEQQMGGMV